MAGQGARNLAFIGLSVTDRKPAKLLVEDPESSGAKVLVIRGDVSVCADVQSAVSVIEGPIWDVFQAAIGLSEALWTRQESVLDFFLLTSSVSGREKGLPGISIGLGMISEVRYLLEKPETEVLLLRKVIQTINEDELFQIIDLALCFTTS
ncbi:hypothetical protein BDW67DRAFT_188900 [Aspergillus spinulosporus]